MPSVRQSDLEDAEKINAFLSMTSSQLERHRQGDENGVCDRPCTSVTVCPLATVEDDGDSLEWKMPRPICGGE